MASRQSAALERKKLMADPIMVTTIVVLIAFLTLFILYPLAVLLVDSVYGPETGLTMSIFQRIFQMPSFRKAITNTLKVGMTVGVLSTLIGLLFAYVEVYVKLRTKFTARLFQVVSMLPVVSPPFVLSLSMIMLFGKAGIITRYLLGIYDNSVYGFGGITVVQTLTFFPVCYMMLKGLLKNIDPSLEEASRSCGATHMQSLTDITLPLIKPAMVSSFFLVFLPAMRELTTSVLLYGPNSRTLGVQIQQLRVNGYMTQAAALSAVAIAIIMICNGVVKAITKDRRGK